ncbi:MAG: GIY-YIG nuclease family protein [Parcubacteria group bacterium]|nr:GIY-YIG nuclease family protein [Parcubacteria group bacterium]
MFYVYLLQSKTKQDQLYVGYTEDLDARFKKHNAGGVQSTKPYRPWSLIYYESFTSKKDAKQREQYLKTTKGRRTLRLMLQDTLQD